MKSIVYIGATLMIGASIYGFVDYNKTRHRKEFKEMYEPTSIGEPAVEEKKLPLLNEKAVAPKVKVLISEDEIKRTEPMATSFSLKKDQPVKKIKTRTQKKFNYREFSRAPLREDKREDLKLQEPVDKKDNEIKKQ